MKAFELEDKADNLCNYCDLRYPDCDSRIRFGNGVGYDNVAGCNAFQGNTEDSFIEEKEYSEQDFDLIYED